MSEMNPLISVIIPAYNGSETIQRAINSILNQTYTNYEIIVVDDGSNDSTVDILKTYQSNITLIKQSNQGTMAARQTGIDVAKGDLIAFLDQDDWWAPEKFVKQIEILKKYPEVGLVLSNLKAVNGNGNMLGFNAIPPNLCYTPSTEDLIAIFPIYPASMLLKKNLIDKIGGLDRNFGFSGAFGDLDMTIRISEVADLYFMDECLGDYFWDEARPGRLNSFLDNLQVYIAKYWDHHSLLNANSSSFRNRFVGACGTFALTVYRLLMKQYENIISYDLLNKLNNHHIMMGNIFGDQYMIIMRLKSIALNKINCQNNALNTLLYLYLLRSDLQSRFPQVIYGDISKYVEWASDVANAHIYDTDSEVLMPFIDEIVALVKTEKFAEDRQMFIAETANSNGIGIRCHELLDRYIAINIKLIDKLFPLKSKRRHLFNLFYKAIKILFTEGLINLWRKSGGYISNKFNRYKGKHKRYKKVGGRH